MKVLFLPAWYPSGSNQVLGVFVKQHALTLNDSINLAVFHVCPNPNLNGLTTFEKTVEDKIVVYRSSFFQFERKLLRPINWLLYFFAAFSGYFKVRKHFGRPDLNHVHVLTRAGVVALVAKFLYKIPYCITEHWSRYLPERNNYQGYIRKVLTKLIVKNSAGLSAVSNNLKQAMQTHGIDHCNFCTISNAVNFDLFTPKTDLSSHGVFKFIHVSGLTDSVKNISGIIKACKILKSEGIGFHLNLVGDCRRKQDLKDLVVDLSLTDCICFSGELRGESLMLAYREANAFVLFSHFENQPCVLLEAFSVGIPVIATHVGGIPEIVTPENGVLTPPSDFKLLAEKMKYLIFHKDQYNRFKIRALAAEKFSYPRVRGTFLEFYKTSVSS